MIYVLASATGALKAWAPTVAELPPAGANSVIVSLAAWDEPPPPPYAWSPSALDFVVPINPARLIPKSEFAARFTFAEQVAIDEAKWDHANATVRAKLRVLAAGFAQEDVVRVADPRIVFYVNQLLDLLVFVGTVTAGNRAARVAAILAP